jgi:DNA repair exonuclease SbcCD ATPase subunit
MPKSRHEQFEKAWEDFMQTINRAHYNLVSLTKNKTCRDHTYHLELSHRTELFRIDTHNPAQDNEVGYVDNPRITTQELDKSVADFFSPHFLKIGDLIMSYVDVEAYTGETNPDCDIYVINVAYYKSHLPFPVKLTRIQQLQKKNLQLERKVESLEEILESTIQQLDAARHSAESTRRRMRIDRRETKEKYVRLMEKMREKLAGYYKDMNQQEDCPVCYETIDITKLKIPACCHYICTSCADRCSPQQCPLCRVEFA